MQKTIIRSMHAFFLSVMCFQIHLFSQDSGGFLNNSSLYFIDQSSYNMYNEIGSPIGWFEMDSSIASVELDWRKFSKKETNDGEKVDASSHHFLIPKVRAGAPKSVYAEIYYDPFLTKHTSSVRNEFQNESSPEKLTLFLHRFGLSTAMSSPGSRLLFGLTFQGFTGSLTKEDDNDKRILFGIDKLSIELASKFANTILCGITVGTQGYYDSLYIAGEDNSTKDLDRFADVRLPMFGAFIDIGNSTLPIHSTFSVNYAKERFLYTIRSNLNSENQNPIVRDSIAFQGKILANLELKGKKIVPAYYLKSERIKNQKLKPREKNNDILIMGEELKDSSWQTNLFENGIGCRYDVLEYVSIYHAYSFQILNIKGKDVTFKFPTAKFYNQYATSFLVNLTKIPNFALPNWITLHSNIGIETKAFNNAFLPDKFELSHVNILKSMSQQDRYFSERDFDYTNHKFNFHYGLNTYFPQKNLGIKLYYSRMSTSNSQSYGLLSVNLASQFF